MTEEQRSMPLPERIEEPELTAVRLFQLRIAQAEAALANAKEAWAIFSPVLAARYQMSEQDRVLPDGTIERQA
jgi:hypothetical protein